MLGLTKWGWTSCTERRWKEGVRNCAEMCFCGLCTGLLIHPAAVHPHGRTDPEDTRVCSCKSHKPGQEVDSIFTSIFGATGVWKTQIFWYLIISNQFLKTCFYHVILGCSMQMWNISKVTVTFPYKGANIKLWWPLIFFAEITVMCLCSRSLTWPHLCWGHWSPLLNVKQMERANGLLLHHTVWKPQRWPPLRPFL